MWETWASRLSWSMSSDGDTAGVGTYWIPHSQEPFALVFLFRSPLDHQTWNWPNMELEPSIIIILVSAKIYTMKCFDDPQFVHMLFVSFTCRNSSFIWLCWRLGWLHILENQSLWLWLPKWRKPLIIQDLFFSWKLITLDLDVRILVIFFMLCRCVVASPSRASACTDNRESLGVI